MSKCAHVRFTAWLALLAGALILSACSTTQPLEEAETAQPEPVIEIEPWEGDGMEIPLDGSSMVTWERSMARVKAHTTDSQYITLENAIKYLLTYDLTAGRDMNKLIKNLDGLTGYEVLTKVRWRRPAPGKGPAEIGAADVKIIDS